MTTGHPWIVPRKSSGDGTLRLFCFPYAGGSASIYRDWPAVLGASVEVCAVELPGRGRRFLEPPLRSVDAIVAAADQALEPVFGARFAFFGHSLGAVVAYELAQALRRRGGPQPVHLWVSGARAPHVPREEPPVHNLPDAEFIAELRSLNGTPAEVFEHPELLSLVLPVLRADFAAAETYLLRDRTPLACPITAIGGLSDVDISRENIDAWRDCTSARFAPRMLPGDHFFINTAQTALLEVVGREAASLLPSRAIMR